MNESGGAQNQTPHHPGASALAPGAYVVIAGFGLSGRAVAEQLEERDISYCVIETNVSTVNRCLRTGMRIIDGSVLDEATLRQANIERATLVALTIPDD